MKLTGNFSDKNMKEIIMLGNLRSVLEYSIENEERLYDIDDTIIEFMKSRELDITPYMDKIVVFKADIVNKSMSTRGLIGMCRTMNDKENGHTAHMIILDSNLDKISFNRTLTHELTHVVQRERNMFKDEVDVDYNERECEKHAFRIDSEYHTLQVSAKVFRYFKLLEIFNIIKI